MVHCKPILHAYIKKICMVWFFYACMYKQCSSVSIVIVLHLLALWTARALLLTFNFLSEFIVTWRNLNKKLSNVLQMLSVCLILKLTKTTVQVLFHGHLWNIAIYTMPYKCSQLEYSKATVYLTVLHPSFLLCAVCCVTSIVMFTVF